MFRQAVGPICMGILGRAAAQSSAEQHSHTAKSLQLASRTAESHVKRPCLLSLRPACSIFLRQSISRRAMR